MSLTGKTIGELTELSAITETTLFPVEFSGETFHIPYSSITTNIKPYKVYTALLSQSGGDDPQSLSSGPVTKGVTYYITDASDGDFSNVGAPSNDDSTLFVAINDEVPNNYGSALLAFNTGAPVVTVLENTIGNIWFTYQSAGIYLANSDDLFINNKVWSIPYNFNENSGDYFHCVKTSFLTSSVIQIVTFNNSSEFSDDILFNTPIEIRVYN